MILHPSLSKENCDFVCSTEKVLKTMPSAQGHMSAGNLGQSQSDMSHISLHCLRRPLSKALSPGPNEKVLHTPVGTVGTRFHNRHKTNMVLLKAGLRSGRNLLNSTQPQKSQQRFAFELRILNPISNSKKKNMKWRQESLGGLVIAHSTETNSL